MAVDKSKDEGREDGQQDDDNLDNIEIVVDEGGEGREAHDTGEGEDRRARTGGDEREGEDDGDKSVKDEDLTPEQREKRAKRKQERELRKQRREEERAELEELRATVRELKNGQTVAEQRAVTTEFRRIEASLREASSQLSEAEKLREEAKKAENWAAHAEAVEAVMDAKDRVTRLSGARDAYVERARQQEAQANQPSPEVERRAREWRGNNAWYDVSMRNEDSRIAYAISESLAADGYRPDTDRYWTELNKRLAKTLPHRVKAKADAEGLDDDIDETPSPTSGSGRERVAGGKTKVRVSKERLEALREAGVDVNNPKEMAPYIKRFQQYDREHADELKRGS